MLDAIIRARSRHWRGAEKMGFGKLGAVVDREFALTGSK
jgi:hypothetical protein